MPGKNKKKVFVAVSGGVDSSVAVLLLKQKGYEVTGCFIKGWYPNHFVCNWQKDRRDALKVCAQLEVPFLTIDAAREYKKWVVDYMIREYRAGRTPNPDVMCNRYIKFGIFLERARKLGADFIATGHYVRWRRKKLKSGAENFELLQAKDKNKDQSYFLWPLTQDQLKHCLFPVGRMLKTEVRKLAQKFELPTAEKGESMGICFIGELDVFDFLKKYIKLKKGKVITPDAKIVGEHQGVMFYTIGQRHGFGGGGGTPYHVIGKDIKNNLLIVADKKKEKQFYKKEVAIEQTNWISEKPKIAKLYKARIRHRQPLQGCQAMRLEPKSAKIVFSRPQRAVAAGQSLVLYKRQTMLGGGIIKFA